MTQAHGRISRRAFVSGAVGAGAAPLTGGRLTRAGQQKRPSGADSSAWKIGIFTRPWDKHDYRVALDAIAEAGFRYAGLMTQSSPAGRLVISAATTPEQAAAIGEQLRQRELRVLSVYGGGIPVEQSLHAGIAAMRRLIDNCAAVRAETLLMGGIAREDLFDRYYQAIAACCDYAAGKDVPITLKPHGGLNATGPQCRRCIERVDHENFRLWYDPGNILYYSDGRLDPVAQARAVRGLVTGMCVKDYRHPKNVAVTPGDGEVDFAAVMKELVRGGLRGGPLVIETLTPGEPAELLREAKRARRFLERLTASHADP